MGRAGFPGAESWSSPGTSETMKGLEGRERGFRKTDHMLVSVKMDLKEKWSSDKSNSH